MSVKISTRGRYGVKALFELSRRYGEGLISLKEIAESQDLSRRYLEQLITPLREADLVESVRGARGGYKLTRRPGQISVGDVLRILEGPLAPVDCASQAEQEGEPCERMAHCSTRDIWIKVRESIEDVVDHISFADLLADEEELHVKK